MGAKRVILGIVAILVAAGSLFAASDAWDAFADTASGKTTEVVIPVNAAAKHDNWYEPKELRITVGDTVVWTNKDTALHTATADDKGFDTGILRQGETSKAQTFMRPGEYLYHCAPHPWMKGMVVVVEGGTVFQRQAPIKALIPPKIETRKRGTVK